MCTQEVTNIGRTNLIIHRQQRENPLYFCQYPVPALGIGDIGGCLERHYFKGRQNYEKYNYEKYYY